MGREIRRHVGQDRRQSQMVCSACGCLSGPADRGAQPRPSGQDFYATELPSDFPRTLTPRRRDALYGLLAGCRPGRTREVPASDWVTHNTTRLELSMII